MLSLPSDPFPCKKGKYEYQIETIVFIVCVYVYENWRDKGIQIGASNVFEWIRTKVATFYLDRRFKYIKNV